MDDPRGALRLALHDGPQSACYHSAATEILYGGAAGGGKSHLLRVLAVSIASAVPGVAVYLFRRYSGDLHKNHIEGPGGFQALLAPWVAAGLVSIVQSPAIQVRFWNGARITLAHLQYDKDLGKYQGAEFHVLLLDELTHFTDKQYRFLRGRCRVSSGLEVPAWLPWSLPLIVCGSNPGGIGHTWVKASWVDLLRPYELRRMEREEGGMVRQYIPAKLADNPSLDRETYADQLAGLGDSELVRAMLEGDWDIVAGGMFADVWRRDKNVLAPFPIPRTWRITRALDWGSAKPFSVGWWAEANGDQPVGDSAPYIPRGSMVRIGEWYGCKPRSPDQGLQMTSEQVAQGIKEREAKMGWKVSPGAADSAIYAQNDGQTIADKMKAKGVRFVPSVKGPGSRVSGWEVMRSMMRAAHGAPAEAAGLWVFDHCREFIRTVPVLPRDPSRPEDVDTDAEDHIADETRYNLTRKRAGAGGRVNVTGT